MQRIIRPQLVPGHVNQSKALEQGPVQKPPYYLLNYMLFCTLRILLP